MEKIIAILTGINSELDYTKEQRMVDDGLFTSFDILQSISALETEIGIDIPVDEITRANFNSVANIAAMVDRLKSR